MTRLHWWLGIGVVIAAVLGHALLPRFDWRIQPGMTGSVRIDRWTGAATWIDEKSGRVIHIGPDLRLTQRPLRALTPAAQRDPILDVLDEAQEP